MSYTASATATQTYTYVDIEKVMRRVKADLVMIASSSSAITETEAVNYAHDIEYLARCGYLRSVDVTLFSSGIEVKASRYDVNTAAGDLSMSRPGGVLWPRVSQPYLRIVLYYTADYTDEARTSEARHLKLSWGPTNADTSHATLRSTGSRDYASGGYGLQRRDFGA
jgi:Bacterial HORMA domain family 1